MQQILADVCLGVGELVGRWVDNGGVGWHGEVSVQAAGWGADEWDSGQRAGCGLVGVLEGRWKACAVGVGNGRVWGGESELVRQWADGVWVEEGSCRH